MSKAASSRYDELVQYLEQNCTWGTLTIEFREGKISLIKLDQSFKNIDTAVQQIKTPHRDIDSGGQAHARPIDP